VGPLASQVRAHFRPEFINRVDEFIVFEPLTAPQIRAIVQLAAQRLVMRLAAQRIGLVLQDSAVDYLAAKGFDPVYGARPVKRALQRELQTLLAQALLRGEFVEDDTIYVAAGAPGSGLVLTKQPFDDSQPSTSSTPAVPEGSHGGGSGRSVQGLGSSGLPGAGGGGPGGSKVRGQPGARQVVVRAGSGKANGTLGKVGSGGGDVAPVASEPVTGGDADSVDSSMDLID